MSRYMKLGKIQSNKDNIETQRADSCQDASEWKVKIPKLLLQQRNTFLIMYFSILNTAIIFAIPRSHVFWFMIFVFYVLHYSLCDFYVLCFALFFLWFLCLCFALSTFWFLCFVLSSFWFLCFVYPLSDFCVLCFALSTLWFLCAKLEPLRLCLCGNSADPPQPCRYFWQTLCFRICQLISICICKLFLYLSTY